MTSLRIEAYFQYQQDKMVVMTLAKDIKGYMDESFQERGCYPLNLRELNYIPVEGISIAYKGNGADYFVVIKSREYGLMISKDGAYQIEYAQFLEIEIK